MKKLRSAKNEKEGLGMKISGGRLTSTDEIDGRKKPRPLGARQV
jgi:hypothetical protein